MTPTRAGLLAALGAYLIWGMFPLYLKLLEGVSATNVLAHRVLWSAVLLAIVLFALNWMPRVTAALRNPVLRRWLLLSAVMIGVNWWIYTWAVLNERVLEASLGYFIQPMFNTILGVAFLGDRLNGAKRIAVALALVGIALAAAGTGGLPLVSLGLAGAFAIYSLARNRAEVDAITGLFIETAMIAPIGLLWLLIMPPGVFGEPTTITTLLVVSGLITTLPLALFGVAARRLTLTTIGFMQYIAPSMVFLLAVFVFAEPLEPLRLAAFAAIWAGLVVFSIGGLKERNDAAKR